MNTFLFAQPVILGFLGYQFKVALILASFYLFYRLLMSKETFHRLNRFLLMGMQMASFILPFCVFTIHRTPSLESLGELMAGHAEIADAPTVPVTPMYELPQYPIPSIGTESEQPLIRTESEQYRTDVLADVEYGYHDRNLPDGPLNWCLVIMVVWALGFTVHLLRTILSMVNVKRLLKLPHDLLDISGCHIYVMDVNVSPFSWRNKVVISRQDYESSSSRAILDHEMAHVRLGHSSDLIITDLLSSFQWFNPVTAFIRKDLQDVHEFQADGRVIMDGIDAKQYQYMLLCKIASMSGFSVANHFKKQNLSSRISMMNRKDSRPLRCFKALFVPVVALVTVSSLAITVYDKTPAGGRKDGRNVDFLKDSMEVYDKRYGQGKFNIMPWEHSGIWLQNERYAKVVTADQVDSVMEISKVTDYLLDYKGCETHRITIVLSNLEGDMTNHGLEIARPLVESLKDVGIYTIVVKTDEDFRRADHSTYRYGRIYTGRFGRYELDYNGLLVKGSADELTEWLGVLDIEYLAFFPSKTMPWSDASKMMKPVYEKGGRTFSICIPEIVQEQSRLARLLALSMDKGQQSRINKQTGFYRITVLPVKRNLDKEFAGKTVMEVEKSLKAEYIDSYEKRAVYTFINPEVKHGREYYKIYFCDDALVLVRREQLGRDNWIKAGGDEDGYIAVIADGKEYRMVANNGLQDFGDYEYHDEYGYANGSYFWFPESGEIYTAMVFEPVPLDVTSLDVVSVSKENNTSSYISRGVRTSIDRDFLKDTRIVNVKGETLMDLEGTFPGNTGQVEHIEIAPTEMRVFLSLRINAAHDYPASIGSDLVFTLNDGTKLGLLRSDKPLDKDFSRGGDFVKTDIELIYPLPDNLDKLLKDSVSGVTPRLSGTVCHSPFNLDLLVSEI